MSETQEPPMSNSISEDKDHPMKDADQAELSQPDQHLVNSETNEDAIESPPSTGSHSEKRKFGELAQAGESRVIVKTEESSSSATPSSSDNKTIIVPPTKPQTSYIPLKTGLCYDVRMRYHAKIFTSYHEYIDPHPEDPRRIYRIYKILAEAGLINDPTLSGIDDIGHLMLKIPVREASAEEILLVHTKEHLQFLESTTAMSKEDLMKSTEKGDSVYFNNDSLLGAKLSCGGAIEACKAVVEGKVKNALAVVRPPGHHAEPDAPGGFCLFSNVAVAAKNILHNYPESVKRIVIVDWDVHHGNGTQKAFYDDPRVLYISLHRFELGKYYPGTKAGDLDQVGSGEGVGTNVNIPWPVGGMGDADYMYAFREVIMPMCYEFDPDLVIISSGFDAADGDMIGQCHVSPAGYGHMTHMLKSLARGNLVVVLEGGYNLDSIAISALAVAKTLLGEPPELLKTTIPKMEAVNVIDEVKRVQSPYFKILRPHHAAIEHTPPNSAAESNNQYNLQELIRTKQCSELYNRHKFTPLPVLSTPNNTANEDQMLATPDIFNSDIITIIVHDPLEVWAHVDPLTGLINPAQSLIIDSTADLISWCIKEGQGVIDVNVPEILSSDDSSTSAQEVLLYLWDNYIQYFKVSKINLIGCGESYAGLIHLVGHRDTRNLVRSIISVIDRSPLKPLVPLVDESMTDWFYKNSLVFTSKYHSCWGNGTNSGDDNGGSKRPRRKFGRVLRGDTDGVDQLLKERMEEIQDFVLDSLEDWDDSS
ncbi:hypothetical protein WICPIJ_004023 [Wickerhamomyces pijperi]|uniref:Histone deacetylase n=1 Tax=Wickerhamomyces pijperi TaxID=599730 RepID=A0A9P8TN59_WICPI|nr:hypothetical protein WICPIJ_004023 [Wickerhamomyces pijperi]